MDCYGQRCSSQQKRVEESRRDRQTPSRTRRGPADGERELVPALEAEEIEFREKMTDADDAFGDQYYLVPA
jgi:hypothetical protein